MSKNLIGERVREARYNAKHKITQANLITRLQLLDINLDSSAICRIETGKRPVTDKELVAIASVLNVSVNWLLKID